MNLDTLEKKTLPQHSRSEGTLAVLEFLDLTFRPNRILYVVGAPAGSVRGNHAHYKNKQIILCLQGQIAVYLWDGIKEKCFPLYPHEYVFVDNLIWDKQVYITGKDIMMSIHSDPFREDDHITNKEIFLAEVLKMVKRVKDMEIKL